MPEKIENETVENAPKFKFNKKLTAKIAAATIIGVGVILVVRDAMNKNEETSNDAPVDTPQD